MWSPPVEAVRFISAIPTADPLSDPCTKSRTSARHALERYGAHHPVLRRAETRPKLWQFQFSRMVEGAGRPGELGTRIVRLVFSRFARLIPDQVFHVILADTAIGAAPGCLVDIGRCHGSGLQTTGDVGFGEGIADTHIHGRITARLGSID